MLETYSILHDEQHAILDYNKICYRSRLGTNPLPSNIYTGFRATWKVIVSKLSQPYSSVSHAQLSDYQF